MEEQRIRTPSGRGPGGTRDEVIADVARDQEPVHARQGSTTGADPSVHRGLPRRVALFVVIGAAVGVIIALALIPVLWSVPLLVALAAVGAVIGGVLAALFTAEREDGRVDARVDPSGSRSG
jgi:membrane associated rhomboid family serine protease